MILLYTVKQSSMNAMASGLIFSRISSGIGGVSPLAILYIAPTASSLLQGRRPTNISSTTQPKDQMSTLAL